MDSYQQRIFHSLLESGALGKGMAISELKVVSTATDPATLVYRTRERDWVVVARKEANREVFLKLAQTAMDHAIDHEGVPTETGIACESIEELLRGAADRLNINVFEVTPVAAPGTCGFCGTIMSLPSEEDGWGRCPRCARLFGDKHQVQLCTSCLACYGAVPEVEERLKELSVDTGSPWPVVSLCPACRSPDPQPVYGIDLLVKGVSAGRFSMDRIKEAGLPKEFLQLINLRVQAKR